MKNSVRFIYNLYAWIYCKEASQIRWFRARTCIEEFPSSKLGVGEGWKYNFQHRHVAQGHVVMWRTGARCGHVWASLSLAQKLKF